MANNYAISVPKDRSGDTMQGLPPNVVAKQVTAGTPAASSVITFGSNTTAIEITAGNNMIAMKWGSASVVATAGSANYDHLIPINTTRRFVVPVETQGNSMSVVGANTGFGLYSTCAVIVASSVLVGITEY